MQCRFPDCKQKADHSWATVPVCRQHYLELWREARNYYKGLVMKRRLYREIREYTPWGRKDAK